MLVPVILAGGQGTRLWPLSRQAHPKQFMPLLGKDSLFQQTIARTQALTGITVAPPVVVAHEDHRFLVDAIVHLIQDE